MTDIRLTVQGLAVDYPTARVVDNVSFTLGNERLALVGESGSGKSMTARALMGLVRKPGVVSAERLEGLGRGNQACTDACQSGHYVSGHIVSGVDITLSQ